THVASNGRWVNVIGCVILRRVSRPCEASGRRIVQFNKSMAAAAAIVLTLGLPAQEKKKEWKDRAEYDLYDGALKDLNANARLESLEKWRKQYPQSDYADVRLQVYLVTYRQLNRVREAFDTAAEILKDNPFHVIALATIAGNVYLLNPAT